MAVEPYYQVLALAGGGFYDLSHDLSSFTVEEQSGQPDKLSFSVSDQYKLASHVLRTGVELEVDLGHSDDHSLVFRGQIYRVEGSFQRDGTPSLKVQAYDRSAQMGLRRRSCQWTNTSLAEIVRTIAGRYFRTASVTVDDSVEQRIPLKLSGNGLFQQGETDLAFLGRLAARYACEVFVVADELDDYFVFTTQAQVFQTRPKVTLAHGRCGVPGVLNSFEANDDISSASRPRSFVAMNYETGQRLTAMPETQAWEEPEDVHLDEGQTAFRSREPLRAAQMEALTAAAPGAHDSLLALMGADESEVMTDCLAPEDPQLRAANQPLISRLGMRASGSTLGNHRIHAQAMIAIADAGHFSGSWYLAQVRHILDGEGYRTEFQCQR